MTVNTKAMDVVDKSSDLRMIKDDHQAKSSDPADLAKSRLSFSVDSLLGLHSRLKLLRDIDNASLHHPVAAAQAKDDQDEPEDLSVDVCDNDDDDLDEEEIAANTSDIAEEDEDDSSPRSSPHGDGGADGSPQPPKIAIPRPMMHPSAPGGNPALFAGMAAAAAAAFFPLGNAGSVPPRDPQTAASLAAAASRFPFSSLPGLQNPFFKPSGMLR